MRDTEHFITNEEKDPSSKLNNWYSKWWNQLYPTQKAITGIIESYHFRALVIILVVADTSLVITDIMLDSFKIHYQCHTGKTHYSSNHHTSNHHKAVMIEHIEIGMELAHYSSIVILTFFLIELIVKIYALGKEFYNFRRRKMEYFDAFIVISSFSIDVYFLRGEENILGEKLLLILTFRLWRFIRIISSVTEATIHGQTKHKKTLNQQYLIAVHRLVDLIKHKTNYIENNKENSDSILEHFRMIDDRCQSALDKLNENHELTSSLTVAQFVEDLHGAENKDKDMAIVAMISNSPVA